MRSKRMGTKLPMFRADGHGTGGCGRRRRASAGKTDDARHDTKFARKQPVITVRPHATAVNFPQTKKFTTPARPSAAGAFVESATTAARWFRVAVALPAAVWKAPNPQFRQEKPDGRTPVVPRKVCLRRQVAVRQVTPTPSLTSLQAVGSGARLPPPGPSNNQRRPGGSRRRPAGLASMRRCSSTSQSRVAPMRNAAKDVSYEIRRRLDDLRGTGVTVAAVQISEKRPAALDERRLRELGVRAIIAETAGRVKQAVVPRSLPFGMWQVSPRISVPVLVGWRRVLDCAPLRGSNSGRRSAHDRRRRTDADQIARLARWPGARSADRSSHRCEPPWRRRCCHRV